MIYLKHHFTKTTVLKFKLTLISVKLYGELGSGLEFNEIINILSNIYSIDIDHVSIAIDIVIDCDLQTWSQLTVPTKR